MKQSAKEILEQLQEHGSKELARVTISLDSEVLEQTKKHLNGAPFSHLVNRLLKDFLNEVGAA